jgi:hypothetical protein
VGEWGPLGAFIEPHEEYRGDRDNQPKDENDPVRGAVHFLILLEEDHASDGAHPDQRRHIHGHGDRSIVNLESLQATQGELEGRLAFS